MSDVDHPVNDFDNHYYEAIDAFTRHLDPKLGRRIIQWAEIDGRKYHVIGGKVSHAVTNPTFDPVSPAGCMAEYFRGNASGKLPMEYLGSPEPIRPEYPDRDARLKTMDDHNLQKIWLFPTLGMIYEEPLKHDPEAVGHLFRSFNQWLLEDWGFAYQDRIFAGPYISLADPEWAVKELQWALDNDARTIVMRPAPVYTKDGVLPPGDPYFDKFWGLVNESGITTVVHAGDTGYSLQGYAPEKGFSASFGGGSFRPNLGILHIGIERAIYDWLGSIMVDRIFERFPNLRIASVENGSGFLADLHKKLRSASAKAPGLFKTDPVELFRENIWINPFWEDDVNDTVAAMGADRVVFGSDWPHIEGMPEPLDYVEELGGFTDADARRILLENAEELNTPRPA